MPVLPLVASSRRRPGSHPRSKASSTMARPARSLTLPPGFAASSFTWTPRPACGMRASATSGVWPMRSSTGCSMAWPEGGRGGRRGPGARHGDDLLSVLPTVALERAAGELDRSLILGALTELPGPARIRALVGSTGFPLGIQEDRFHADPLPASGHRRRRARAARGCPYCCARPGQGHARHRARHARRAGDGPDPRHPRAPRALPRAGVGLARRVRPREGRRSGRAWPRSGSGPPTARAGPSTSARASSSTTAIPSPPTT